MQSLPVRGAWIEMALVMGSPSVSGSLPVRGAWIEINVITPAADDFWSLPVRGAWIEMPMRPAMRDRVAVAPRAGSVD